MGLKLISNLPIPNSVLIVFPKHIEAYIEEHNLTFHEFCKLCDIELSDLEAILSDSTKVNIEALEKITNYTDERVYLHFYDCKICEL